MYRTPGKQEPPVSEWELMMWQLRAFAMGLALPPLPGSPSPAEMMRVVVELSRSPRS